MALLQTASPPGFVAATSFPVNFGSNTSPGSLISVSIILIGGFITGNPTISDGGGNSYTLDQQAGLETGGGPFAPAGIVYGFYAKNIIGSWTSMTITPPASLPGIVIAREYSGMAVNPFDSSNGAVSNVTTTPTSPSISTSNPKDLIIGIGGILTSGTVSVGSSFGNLVSTEFAPISTAFTLSMEDKTVLSTGSYASSFGVGSSSNSGMIVEAFKFPSTGSDSDNSGLLMMSCGC
jgi:hypothetical protein